jgi:transcriptional regulator with XRE-family HTH domain
MHTFLQTLRTKNHYSQEDLAKLIGVSRQTFAKIETGKVELTVSQVEKLAATFNLSLEDFLAGKVSPEAQLCIQEEYVVYETKSTTRISVPQKNISKFKEVLLYILEKVGAKVNIGEAVICKLLYFIDFDYYEKYEEQLMGAIYIKNHYGPTPAEFTNIVEVMTAAKDLVRVEQEYFKFQQTKYLPLRKPDLTKLSAQEIEHVDWVLARLSDKNAKEMEDYSHRDVPWITAEKMASLDYEAVFYRTAEFSVRKYDDEV